MDTNDFPMLKSVGIQINAGSSSAKRRGTIYIVALLH